MRAADVTLKEGRPLVLVVRETPLHRGHLRLMGLAAEAGAVIFPPVPAFYTRPQTLDEMVDNTVARVPCSAWGSRTPAYQASGGGWDAAGVGDPMPIPRTDPVDAAGADPMTPGDAEAGRRRRVPRRCTLPRRMTCACTSFPRRIACTAWT